MPQLDIYTFSTQIYFVAACSFIFLCVFSYALTYVFFFESEIFEKDEQHLNQAKVLYKYEALVLKSRFDFIAQRFADIIVLFFQNTPKAL